MPLTLQYVLDCCRTCTMPAMPYLKGHPHAVNYAATCITTVCCAQVLFSGIPSWLLLKAARIASAGLERTQAYRALSGEAINAAADIRAFRLLQKLCTETLAALPTSLQQDVDFLRASACSNNLAVQWRACYKGTLHKCISVCKRAEAFWHESSQQS